MISSISGTYLSTKSRVEIYLYRTCNAKYISDLKFSAPNKKAKTTFNWAISNNPISSPKKLKIYDTQRFLKVQFLV